MSHSFELVLNVRELEGSSHLYLLTLLTRSIGSLGTVLYF